MIRLDVTEAMIDYSKNHIIQWLDLNVGRYSGIEQYRNAKIYNKVPFELFLVNLYKTEAIEFREFIEDLINGDLSAGQKVWAEGLMQPPQDEEEENDDDYEYR
jgi:hypothetical protein